MGIVVPIVSTVGTVAGIASQQAAASRQREALAAQAAQNQLGLELQQRQLNVAREAAVARSAKQIEQQQWQLSVAQQAAEQQKLSDALSLLDARNQVNSAAYYNEIQRLQGLTIAQNMRSQAADTRVGAANTYQQQIAANVAAGNQRANAVQQQIAAENARAQPYQQALDTYRQLGAQANEVRRENIQPGSLGDYQRLLAQRAMGSVQGDINNQVMLGDIQGQNLEAQSLQSLANSRASQIQADSLGGRADMLTRDANYQNRNVGAQQEATQLQYGQGNAITDYNRKLLEIQEVLNRRSALVNPIDNQAQFNANIAGIQAENLATAANLEANRVGALSAFNAQQSALAANAAGIRGPNVLAGMANVAQAWMPYGMQQGWFAGPMSTPAPQLDYQRGVLQDAIIRNYAYA